jgi:GNAT superfamily N-acetyltransferase
MDGVPVATFRIDGEGISYTVAPDHRNRGIAKLMLKEVSSRFGRRCAHVYADSEPSIRVARSVGLDVVIIDGQTNEPAGSLFDTVAPRSVSVRSNR